MPEAFRIAIESMDNDVYLSVASVWEAVIKFGLGKLPLPAPPAEYLPKQRAAHGITSLSIDEETMAFLARLPSLHRDPFDRLIISQAQEHGMVIATVDPNVAAYGITVLPA